MGRQTGDHRVLMPGWRIVRAEPVNIEKRGSADFRWDSAVPPSGSDNPYVKMHLWAEAGARILVRYRVRIERPQGTDPYY